MTSAARDLQDLRARVPSDHGLTVFDAETQDTSYGTLIMEDLPLIFDTHRKEGKYIATAELLTEVATPARVSPRAVASFVHRAAQAGALAIPYSACFFKGNLHVYMYDRLVRGFDLATIGESVSAAESALESKLRGLWAHLPQGIVRTQRALLAGRRSARYDADLEVLRRRLRERHENVPPRR